MLQFSAPRPSEALRRAAAHIGRLAAPGTDPGVCRVPAGASTLIAVTFILLLAQPAAAQRRTIFAYDSGQWVRPAVADPLVVRQRDTDVDLIFLRDTGPTGGFAAPAPARSIVLNLFRDAEFTAFLDRVELVSTIGYAWVGSVAGVEGSVVILAVSDGVLTASVEVGTTLYSVRQSAPGRYVITQVDHDVPPPEAPPIAVTTQVAAQGPAADAGDTYDLLVLYTSTIRALVGGTSSMQSLIVASIARVNTAYPASGVQTRCRLVGAVETEYAESGDIGVDLNAIQSSASVGALRDRHGADIVSLIVANDRNGYAGVGYLMTRNDASFAPWAYNACRHYNLAWNPTIGVMTHEIGHNQGAHHEPGNGCPGLFPYSCAYNDVANQFYTVMSYGTACAGCQQVMQFSNPTILYRGVPTGSATQDNARTLNESRVAVANFRQAQTTLGAPSNLTASSAGSNVLLQWTAPAVGAPIAYTVEAGSAPGLANLANFSTGNAATSFGAGGVGDGAYYVRVKAANGETTSAASNEVLLRVGCSSAPGAPSGLTITQNSGGNVAFLWTAASGSPAGYTLRAGSAPGLSNLAIVDVGNTTAFAAGGVGAGTYYVRVVATNACGTSGASNEVVLTVR